MRRIDESLAGGGGGRRALARAGLRWSSWKEMCILTRLHWTLFNMPGSW